MPLLHGRGEMSVQGGRSGRDAVEGCCFSFLPDGPIGVFSSTSLAGSKPKQHSAHQSGTPASSPVGAVEIRVLSAVPQKRAANPSNTPLRLTDWSNKSRHPLLRSRTPFCSSPSAPPPPFLGAAAPRPTPPAPAAGRAARTPAPAGCSWRGARARRGPRAPGCARGRLGGMREVRCVRWAGRQAVGGMRVGGCKGWASSPPRRASTGSGPRLLPTH